MSFSVKSVQPELVLDPARPVHFVGVGGVGMSGLAKILAESGYSVSGSDLGENAYTRAVAEAGGQVYQGHQADHVPEGAMLIVSSSIDAQNPEIAAALAQGLPLYHRSDLLREIFQGQVFGHQTPVGITGTHGKTTITGMTGLALRAAGLDPTIVVGGKMPELATNAVLGRKKAVSVAELDESDGTIVQYQPAISVIANLELDHADHYTEGLSGVMQTFRQYLSALPRGSQVLYNVACPNTRLLLAEHPAHLEAVLLSPEDVFSGTESQPRYWLKNARMYERGCYQAYVYRDNKLLGELTLSVPGRHSVFNALCAVAVGDRLGASFEPMAEALNRFSGMGRRFEVLGNWRGARLVDDYAHHPSEVTATLRAARESIQGQGRVLAVFQPHRYTRLQALWEDFARCFGDADQLYLADVYAAHEPEIPEVTSKRLIEVMTHPHAQYVPTQGGFDPLRAVLKQEIQPGDVVLSMGAGTITQLLRGWPHE